MAKELHTAEDLDAIANRIVAIITKLRKVAEDIRTESMPGIELFSATLNGQTIPALNSWVVDAESAFGKQVEFHRASTLSRSEIQRRYYQKRKLEIAKQAKPTPHRKPAKKSKK